jgi:hypothetical protein
MTLEEYAEEALDLVTALAVEKKMPQHQVALAMTVVLVAITKATARPGQKPAALYAAAMMLEREAHRLSAEQGTGQGLPQ